MDENNIGNKGIGGTPEDEFPQVSKKVNGMSPIQRLGNPEVHELVRKYLVERIQLSETEMSKLKPRWRVNEKKYQAYITLPKWEEVLKAMNDSGEAPKVVSMVVPYMFASG